MKKQIKEIIYFENPGPQNTDAVIEAVKRKVKELGTKYMVVASESGKTALKVAKAFKKSKVKIICVTAYAGIRKAYGNSNYLSNGMRKKLRDLKVKILEETPWIFLVQFDYSFLKEHTPSTIVHRFLSRIMGYGFKTAIEIAIIAADIGAVPTNEEIISIAGTGWMGGGADCAIVVKSAGIVKGEFISPKSGLEVKEIIAIPRLKFTQGMIKRIAKRGI